MKKIAIIGAVDKRVIAYPLLKVLTYLGKVLVVTDESTYRRFDENYSRRFEANLINYWVETEVTEKTYQEVDNLVTPYDFVVFITTNEIPPSTDKIIYCRGIDKGFGTPDVVQQLEEKPIDEVLTVYVTFSKLEDKTLIRLEPSKTMYMYIAECEDKKEFVDLKDTATASMLYKFFEDELGVPKSTIQGLLKRKEGGK